MVQHERPQLGMVDALRAELRVEHLVAAPQLAERLTRLQQRLDQVRERGVAVAPRQVALAWLLARYDRMLLIPGTTSVAHLEENLAAGDLELDDEDLATLEQVTQLGNPMAAS